MKSILKKRLLTVLILVAVTFSLGAENIYHTVRKGETLYSISKKYNVPIDKLKSANRMDSSSTIKVGAKLLVPGSNDESTPIETDRAIGFYRIKKGDTFYSVAKKFKMKLSDLYAMNKMSANDLLRVDFKLKVLGSKLTKDTVPKPIIDKKTIPAKETQSVIIITQPDKTKSENVTTDSTISSKNFAVLKEDKSIKLPVAGSYKPMSGKLRGAEITVSKQDYFKALEDGTVIWKGPFREFKNVILVDSGNYVYLFGGMDDIYVNVGQKVRRGDRIGGVGRSQNSKIYFSAFKDRMALDYKDVIWIINKRNI